MIQSTHRRSHSSLRFAVLALVAGLLLLGLVACLRAPATELPSTLTYEGPQAYTLKPGDLLPGTNIRYVRRTNDGAEFLIGDQPAIKQKADSLNGSGPLGDGVQLDLRLRIIWFTDQALYTAGTAKLTVRDTAPQAGGFTEAPLSYQMPVAYTLRKQGTVPGTGLSYEGKTQEGAQFAGIEGYPYRQLGDSLRWQGRLRPNVALRLDLRVLEYDDNVARVGGIAHLYITP